MNMDNEMNKVRMGVVGIGHLGTIHTKIWKSAEDVELIGLFDVDTEKSAKLAEELSVTSFASYDEMLDNVDAVTIASSTLSHFDLAQTAIERGKHCFIEKPITSTFAEAEKLMASARTSNLVIQVGHVERFNPAIAALGGKELNPMFIEAHRLSQFRPRATDVSVIHDLMIHDIDLMLWLIKSPVKSIDATGVSVITETIDIANARIKFENGAVANLTASRLSANPMRKMRIFQKNAYLSIDFGNQEVEIFRIAEPSEVVNENTATMLGSIGDGIKNKNIYYEKPTIIKQNAIEEEHKAFTRAILEGTPIAVNALEAAAALLIAEKISNLVQNT